MSERPLTILILNEREEELFRAELDRDDKIEEVVDDINKLIPLIREWNKEFTVQYH